MGKKEEPLYTPEQVRMMDRLAKLDEKNKALFERHKGLIAAAKDGNALTEEMVTKIKARLALPGGSTIRELASACVNLLFGAEIQSRQLTHPELGNGLGGDPEIARLEKVHADTRGAVLEKYAILCREWIKAELGTVQTDGVTGEARGLRGGKSGRSYKVVADHIIENASW